VVIGPAAGERAAEEDAVLVARLRGREERAFEEATSTFYPAMFAVARAYVRSGSDAEEVVQDAWLGVLKGLERFEGRSRLRTWVLQIVANIARDRAVREARSLPFSSLEDDAGEVRTEELGPGDHKRVETGRIHRYEAIERVELMEVSTPELDDVVRLEDDYGREGTSEA